MAKLTKSPRPGKPGGYANLQTGAHVLPVTKTTPSSRTPSGQRKQS